MSTKLSTANASGSVSADATRHVHGSTSVTAAPASRSPQGTTVSNALCLPARPRTNDHKGTGDGRTDGHGAQHVHEAERNVQHFRRRRQAQPHDGRQLASRPVPLALMEVTAEEDHGGGDAHLVWHRSRIAFATTRLAVDRRAERVTRRTFAAVLRERVNELAAGIGCISHAMHGGATRTSTHAAITAAESAVGVCVAAAAMA